VEERMISTPKNGKTTLLKCEEHAHCFSDIQEAVHYEFVPQPQITNQHYYTDALQHLWENVW
jgi:hypothetical protein